MTYLYFISGSLFLLIPFTNFAHPQCPWASQVVLEVKNLPANARDTRDTQVQSLGQEDPLEEEMATLSRITKVITDNDKYYEETKPFFLIYFF